jgi:BlaI family penicillinase repressor
MSKNMVELTEAEWSIIKAVWDAEPCTATLIQERLLQPMGWHYSTVRTLMDRMAAKGVLTARKEGRLTVYRSAVTRKQAQNGELFYTLKHAFNGAFTPMLQCLLDNNEIDAGELAKMEALIKARKKSVKK